MSNLNKAAILLDNDSPQHSKQFTKHAERDQISPPQVKIHKTWI